MYHCSTRHEPLLSFTTCCAVPSGVPSNVNTAATQIRQSVRTALVSGHRRVCVDTLLSAIDPRARTFDQAAAELVFNALLESVQPLISESTATIQVVVPGSAAALRVQNWLKRSHILNVSVDVLGAEEHQNPSAVIVVDPYAEASIRDYRTLLRDANRRNAHVVVHNQPRDDALYKMLGYGGFIPVEMIEYKHAFMLAPFAIREKNSAPLARFAIMRQFPAPWKLWRYLGDDETFVSNDESNLRDGEYDLCAEFKYRPDNAELMNAISSSLG